MDLVSQKLRVAILAIALGFVTLAAFWPVVHNEFLRYDDPLYVKENPHVLRGITAGGVAWAMSASDASNWHPVTWLSHMLDVQLFGLRPGWHHFTSLALHTANAVLLFLLLARLTGHVWRSAVVGALFALHPLHVESVAWIAERKDVLSMFFLLLTVWAYAAYACARGGPAGLAEGGAGGDAAPVTGASRGRRMLGLALVFFALGLMSKPMLVTAPFLLLLLDFWPLGRWPSPSGPGARQQAWGLAREKLPFFALAALSSFVTYGVQAKAHAVTLVLPFWPRVENAVVSYVKYVGKMFWPAKLAVFYPHPDTRWPVSEQWLLWLVGLAALGLVAVSVFAFGRRRDAPWFFTGWFWFAGTLVPVIGLVQVGGQAMADRYTYIPLTGLFICLAWGGAALAGSTRWARTALGGAAALAILALTAVSHAQVGYWRNEVSLFEHALAVTKNNAVAHCHLGASFGEQGQYDAAIAHYRAAQAAAPALADGYAGLGYTFELQGKAEEAVSQYQAALQLKPWDSWVHHRLAVTLWFMGRREEALKNYSEAIRLRPDWAEARFNFGAALAEQRQTPEAITQFTEAARLDPANQHTLLRLGELLLSSGKLAEAEARFRQITELAPESPDARINLGGVLWMRGRRQEALAEYAAAVKLNPGYAVAHYNLGTAFFSQGRLVEAAASFAEAARLKPDYIDAITGLGRALAGQGKLDEAIAVFRRSLAVRREGFTLLHLGIAQAASGRGKEAAESLRAAVEARPDWPPALSELAWVLATDPDGNVRNGAEALRLARRAVELTGGRDLNALAALDAAYGEAGQFAEATATAQRVRDSAVASGQPEVAKAAEARLSKYEKKEAYHR